MIKNNGSERVAGKAEVQGWLDLGKLKVYEMAQDLNQSGLSLDAFQKRFEKHPNGGSDLSEITKSIPMIFENGWVDEPVAAVVDIPLDDDDVDVFDFCVDVDINVSKKGTQIIVFDVAIPRKYSHRAAKFEINSVKPEGD